VKRSIAIRLHMCVPPTSVATRLLLFLDWLKMRGNDRSNTTLISYRHSLRNVGCLSSGVHFVTGDVHMIDQIKSILERIRSFPDFNISKLIVHP
jgi:hypothetical protein